MIMMMQILVASILDIILQSTPEKVNWKNVYSKMLL